MKWSTTENAGWKYKKKRIHPLFYSRRIEKEGDKETRSHQNV